MVLSLLQNATKSWKTTAGGFIAGLLILLPEVQKLLDSTEGAPPADWNVIIAVLLAMITAALARDGDKSSEDHGKHDPKPGVQT